MKYKVSHITEPPSLRMSLSTTSTNTRWDYIFITGAIAYMSWSV